MTNPFDLQRFVDAQQGVIDTAMAELRAGRKRSHWMWFVFPQIAGLGSSAMARRYAIGSRAEATAYLAHPVLGARLVEGCALAMTAGEAFSRSAAEIFGHPDDAKFRSCLTLFSAVSAGVSGFDAGLRQFFGGVPDAATLALLAG